MSADLTNEKNGMFGVKGTGDTSGYGGLVRSATQPGSSQRPYGSYFDEVADELERAYPLFSDAIEKVVVDRGELTLHIKRERLVEVARILRDTPSLRFEMCMGVSGVHYPEEKGRELHAVYPLLSLTIPSLVEVWAGNNWNERETYDMFGIIFDGHPALTRILMPDDWPGHPQRKDYPLGGIDVEYKGAVIPAPDRRRSYQ